MSGSNCCFLTCIQVSQEAGTFLMDQAVNCLPAMREIWVRSLGCEDPLEKEIATHSSTLAWKIPWTEEPGRLQTKGSQRVRHDWAAWFLRRQVRWSGIPISLRFFQFVVIHTVKGFSVVNEAEMEVFLEFSCFFYDLVDVDNMIYCSSAFSKSSLNIWKLTVHILLKPSLEDFEHYFASMWNEY